MFFKLYLKTNSKKLKIIKIKKSNKIKTYRKNSIRNSRINKLKFLNKSNNKSNKSNKSIRKIEVKSIRKYIKKKYKKRFINGSKLEIKFKTTLQNGNCFFSSIYRSLINKNLLKKTYRCIPELKSSSERNFIKRLKYFISDRIDNNIKELFNYYTISKFDLSTFKEVTKYLGSISIILRKYYIENKFISEFENKFVEEIKNTIKTDKNWVGQLEVEYVYNLFKNNCDIDIKLYNTITSSINDIKKNIFNKSFSNTIYLLNLKEKHWIYLTI